MLRRARLIQRTTGAVVRTGVIHRMDLRRVGPDVGLLVGGHRIGIPARPQLDRGGHELLGAGVAFLVPDVSVVPEVSGLGLRQGGDDVPCDATAGQMVQRTEHPRQFVGVKVGGGLGDRDTQTRGDRREAGRHQAGIEGGRGLGAASERFGLITPEPVGSSE